MSLKYQFQPTGWVHPKFAGPDAPTNVGVWAGETQASLYWRDASGGDATGFKVYRSTTQGFTPGAGNLVHTTGVTEGDVYDGRAGYVDTGLTNATTYYYRVKATDGTDDSSATSEISVTPTDGGAVDTSIGGGANEPAGTTRVMEWDMGHAFPPFLGQGGCDLLEGIVGSGLQDTAGSHEQREHVLVYDDTAPRGGPLCHEIRYPAHKTGESSFEKVWAWETPVDEGVCFILNDSEHEYEEVYIRETRKIWTDRDDGEVEDFGTGASFKFSHVKGHLTEVNNTKGWSFTMGPAIDTGTTSQASYTMKYRISWTDNAGTRQADTSTSASKVINVGQWHEIEWYMKANTVDGSGNANADGIVKCWVDGVLVIDDSTVKMRSGAETNCLEYFQSYDQVTTWSGGPSNVHTHNKGWLTSHVYISGIKGAAA